MSEYTIRILHLSDIHMRGPHEKELARRERVLGEAWDRNLDDLLAEGPIDLICLTGDIANTGQADEYEDATRFIARLRGKIGLDIDRVFVVPGNHDVNRKVSAPAWRALRKHAPNARPLDFSRWLAGGNLPSTRGLKQRHRDEILLRQKAFLDWVAGPLGRPELLPHNSPHGRLGYRVSLKLPEKPFEIHVLGLDSAWLAGDDSDAENLRLSEDQVLRLCRDAKGHKLAGLRLALVHHPLHSLFDHSECQRLLSETVDLLLRGHLHKQDLSLESRPDQQLRQSATGSLFEGSHADHYQNSCQVIKLTLNQLGRPLQIDFRFRVWSPEGHWHDDSSRTKLAPQGRLRWVMKTEAQFDHWEAASIEPQGRIQVASNADTVASVQSPSTARYDSLLDGMRTLSVGPQVRRFFESYLGTPDQPEPFGGRTPELQALQAWLDADQRPCMVLAAPAGAGKSALLCRFCAELLPRTNLAIVFFPISIRYQTNLEGNCLPAVVSRLCLLHGETPPRIELTPPMQWRLLLDQYLTKPLPDGRTLLLILDGLDEAGDFQVDRSLLPTHPHRQLRILVAARSRVGELGADGWRQRLGWATETISVGLTLAPLDVDGVAQALTSLGLPLDQLAERGEIVVQLHRLSRGEPLLVQLWCHRLWQQKEHALRLTTEQLSGYPPGLKGYMQELWTSRSAGEKDALRQKQDAQLVLEILASALGPLRREELLRLAPEIGRLQALHEALAPLSRFVIGDGKAQGYVFSHSLFRDYFRDEEMLEDQRLERDARFLTYGQQVALALHDGMLASENVPSYVLRYYGSHLKNAGRPSEYFLQLVTNRWRLAWEQHEGGSGGFLHDVQRAADCVANEDAQRVEKGGAPQRLDAMIRCALCVATMRSIQNGVYYRLIQHLVERDVWTVGQALAYVQQMTEERSEPGGVRKTLFAMLLPRLPDNLLLRALDVALDMANQKFGSLEQLNLMWERLAKTIPNEAIAAAHGLGQASLRVSAMANLARFLPASRGAALRAQALDLARAESAKQKGTRTGWLRLVFEYLPEPQRERMLLEIEEEVPKIEDLDSRAYHYEWLAQRLPRRARIRALDALFALALRSPKEHALITAVDILADFTKPTQRRILRRILPHREGPEAILRFTMSSGNPQVPPLAPAAQIERWNFTRAAIGEAVFDKIVFAELEDLRSDNPWPAVQFLRNVVHFLTPAQRKAAASILRKAPVAGVLAHGLSSLAAYSGPKRKLEALALLLDRDWEDEHLLGMHDLQHIFRHLDVKDLGAAETLIAKAPSAGAKAWASILLALRVEGSRRLRLLEQARSSAHHIKRRKNKADILRELWPHFPPEQRLAVLAECCETMIAGHSASRRIQDLRWLAGNLNQPFCDIVIRLALDHVPNLEPGYGRSKVLENILETRGISEQLKKDVLADAIQAARKEGQWSRVHTLTDLSEHAPRAEQKALLLEAFEASRRLDARVVSLQTAFAMRPSESVQQQLIQLIDEHPPDTQSALLAFHAFPNVAESLRPIVVAAGVRAAHALPADDPRSLSSLIRWMEHISSTEKQALAAEILPTVSEWLREHHQFLSSDDRLVDEDLSRHQQSIAGVLDFALRTLFPILPEDEVVALHAQVPPTWWDAQAEALLHTSSLRRGARLNQTLGLAQQQPEEERPQALARLARCLEPAQRSRIVQDALEQSRRRQRDRSSWTDNRGLVLRFVAPYLQREDLPLFTKRLAEVQGEAQQVAGLTDLLGAIPDGLRSSVIEQLLSQMNAWPPHAQDYFLISCADSLSPTWHDRIVEIVPRLLDQRTYRPIGKVIPRLSEQRLRAALATTSTTAGDTTPNDAQLQTLSLVGVEILRRSPHSIQDVYRPVMALLQRRAVRLDQYHLALQHFAPVLKLMIGTDGIDSVVAILLDVANWWR